jgi:hypothetical protein
VGAAGARADEALLAFAGAVALADARRIDESEVTREAKPACRTLEARAKRTQMDILEALSRMGSPAGAPGANADPMGDPALVGAVAGHKQVLADLHAIGTISSAIGAGKPGEGPPDATSKIAPRVLRLGQEFGKPDHPDPAIRALRALAVALEDGAYLKSDGVVHGQALAGWVKVTGGKGAQLSGTAQGSIEDYLSLWSADAAAAPASPHGKNARTPADIQREVDSAAERLHLLRRLVERQVEGATLERMTSAAGAGPDDGYVLQSWPGWEMPAPVLGSLCTGLNERLAGATELAIAGRNDELRRALGAIDKAYSAARLAAALEVRFEGAGLARCAAMAELAESAIPSGGAVEAAAALGIAEETWFGGARGAIADVCRYAPEYAVLLKTDAKKAERLRAYIELRGADAMKAIQER